MITPVNNPTTPVLESANPAIVQEEDCEAIKARFGIETGTHDENTGGKTKKSSRDYQSHHVAQDAATSQLIARGEAIAVMLINSHSGTEHGEITRQQNNRRDNKKYGRGGEQPATTFGDLKKQARDDLVQGLEGRRTDKNGKPMSKEEAEKVADCLIQEAEDAVREKLEEKDIELSDEMPVVQTGGCFARDTLIWIDNRTQKMISAICAGDIVDTASGRLAVTRTDMCLNTLLELETGSCTISIAPFHHVRLLHGNYVRADKLKVGDYLDTAMGFIPISSISWTRERETVYSFGFSRKSACRIGKYGLWVEIPDSGLPVSHYETLSSFTISNESSCQHLDLTNKGKGGFSCQY